MLKNSNNSSKWILNRIIYLCIRIYSRFLAHYFMKFKCSSDRLKRNGTQPKQSIQPPKMNVLTFATHKNDTIQIANLIHLFSTCRTFLEFRWLSFVFDITFMRARELVFALCPNIYAMHTTRMFTEFVLKKQKQKQQERNILIHISICVYTKNT